MTPVDDDGPLLLPHPTFQAKLERIRSEASSFDGSPQPKPNRKFPTPPPFNSSATESTASPLQNDSPRGREAFNRGLDHSLLSDMSLRGGSSGGSSGSRHDVERINTGIGRMSAVSGDSNAAYTDSFDPRPHLHTASSAEDFDHANTEYLFGSEFPDTDAQSFGHSARSGCLLDDTNKPAPFGPVLSAREKTGQELSWQQLTMLDAKLSMDKYGHTPVPPASDAK